MPSCYQRDTFTHKCFDLTEHSLNFLDTVGLHEFFVKNTLKLPKNVKTEKLFHSGSESRWIQNLFQTRLDFVVSLLFTNQLISKRLFEAPRIENLLD